MSNYYWIVNVETPVIALLYISRLSMFHLRSCQFASPVFTQETTLRLLPEGPWPVSEQPSVPWHDKVPLPYTDSWVQAKCSTARTSLVLLPIYSPKARTNYLQLWGSAKLLPGTQVPEGCTGKFHVHNNWKFYQATEFSAGFLNCRFARTSRECKDRKLFHVGFLKSSV